MSDQDIGLQAAIYASLQGARGSGGGGGSSSFSRAPQPAPTRLQPARTNIPQPQPQSFRRPTAAGITSSSSFSSQQTNQQQFRTTNTNMNPPLNGRRNTLERHGIAPTTPSGNRATPRTKSNPVGSNNNTNRLNIARNNNNINLTRKTDQQKKGGMGGKEPEMMMVCEEGEISNNNSDPTSFNQYARNNAPTSRNNTANNIGDVASAYSHLGGAFASAAAASSSSASLSTPPPRPNNNNNNSNDTSSQNISSSSTNKILTVGDLSTANPLPSNIWQELEACIEASGKIQRQNPSGSHLVFDSGNSDSIQSLERVSSATKLYPGDFMGMITSDSITKVTNGAVPPQATGAMFQCAIKPMSKVCTVFVGVLPSSLSSTSSSSTNLTTLLELTFTSSTGQCSASEFSLSKDLDSLSRSRQIERPNQLRAAESSATGARYARAKNQQTDWNLMPITVTISSGALQLDVSGESVMKNIAVPNLDSAALSKIFFAVSGRCTVKNIQIGDVAEIRKQQLVQSVNAASNPMVSVIESEILDRNPNVQWSDVAALDDAKRVLNEAIVLPLLVPEYFTGGLTAATKGVLLYGPPGGGKTLLAKAVATCTKTTFFNISAASIMGKFVGESEKMVRTLFQVARRDAPSTIFFDEIDSVMTKRGGASEHEASRRMKTELLQQMDGIVSNNNGGDPTQNVIVLATVNAPWLLDEAVIRRLEKRIYIPLPNASARLELLKISLKKLKTNFSVEDFMKDEKMMKQMGDIAKKLDVVEEKKQQKLFEKMRNKTSSNDDGNDDGTSSFLAQDPDFQSLSITSQTAKKILLLVEATHGYSGADLTSVLKDASMFPLRRLIGGKSPQEIFEMKQRGELLGPDGQPPPVLLEDIFDALKKVNPSVNQADLFKFVEWEREYGSV